MKKSILSLLLLTTSLANARIATSCAGFLSTSGTTSVTESTEFFLAYLARLYEEAILSIEDINKIYDSLKNRNQLMNPLDSRKTLSSSERIHDDNLKQYITFNQFDNLKIRDWLENFLRQSQKEQQAREDNKRATAVAGREIKFHKVKPGNTIVNGKINEGADGPPSQVQIDYSLLVTETPITQKMWAEVMSDNPSKLLPHIGFATLVRDNIQVNIQSDYPVTNLTLWSAMVFANRMSEKEGLPLVYDFGNTQFSGSADKGDLKAIGDMELKINAPNGDITKALGYRLPLRSELIFLATNRGRSKTQFFSKVTEENMKDYAWYEKNSNQSIYPVAELKPLLIDGNEFYDLYGNVGLLTSDFFVGQDRPIKRIHTITYGGGANAPIVILNPQVQSTYEINLHGNAGFRLVRSLPK